jgi:hypothetical protein
MERWCRALDVMVRRMWPIAAGPLLFDRSRWQSLRPGAYEGSAR